MSEESQISTDQIRAKLGIMNIPIPEVGYRNIPLPPLNVTLTPPKLGVIFLSGDKFSSSIFIPEGSRNQHPIGQIVLLPDPDIMQGMWNGNVPYLLQIARVGDIILLNGPVREFPTSWGENMPVQMTDVNNIAAFYTDANGPLLAENVSTDWSNKIDTEEDQKSGLIIMPGAQ